MAQGPMASRLPALVNAARMAYARVFSAHPAPRIHRPMSSGLDSESDMNIVPHAVSSAGGFEIPSNSLGQHGSAVWARDQGDVMDAAPALPRSLQFLIVNNVAVKPERLLADLPWSRLLREDGNLDAHHRQAAQMEMDRLNTLHRQGMKVDPQTAVQIFRRFTTWIDLMDLSDVLAQRPTVAKDKFEGHMDLYIQDVDLLERMRTKVETCLKNGDYENAQRLADRAIQKSGRLCALLDTLRQRLEDAEEKALERFHRNIRTAGGVLVVAMGANYMGYAAHMPGLPSDIVAATAEAAAIGSVVCVMATTAQWLNTPDFGALLDRVQRMQLQRQVTRNQIDNLACEAMMEAADASRASPQSVVSSSDTSVDDAALHYTAHDVVNHHEGEEDGWSDHSMNAREMNNDNDEEEEGSSLVIL